MANKVDPNARAPLDVRDMVGNMHVRLGIAIGACLGDRYARNKLLELAPFLAALGRLALENEPRALELWKAALMEPQPFGGEPLGLPPTND